MRNKLIVGILGLTVVVVGIAAFAAFTAQIVNLEAHVEKEIEVAAVKNCGPDPNNPTDIICEEDTGNYGTVLPQEIYDKDIEVTLSRSFVAGQRKFNDVVFAVMWECKQNGTQDNWNNLSLDANGKYNLDVPDGWPDCRNRLPHTDPLHPNGELDDNLRNYATIVTAQPNCLTAAPPSGVTDGSLKPAQKQVELQGFGVIFKGTDLTKKCFYQVKLLAPPCEGEFNPFTDPAGPNVKTTPCHFIQPTTDPQTWEHSADIGDDFKIQVIEHSLAGQ